jgi:hypothetical protein
MQKETERVRVGTDREVFCCGTFKQGWDEVTWLGDPGRDTYMSVPV